MSKVKKGYHWWVDEEDERNKPMFSNEIITMFNLKNYSMYICYNKEEWNSLFLTK